MEVLDFSFSINFSSYDFNSVKQIESHYQNFIKPIMKFLFSNPEFSLSLSFNGAELQYLRKKHQDFIKILHQLVQRKQLELYGNGFYNPVFPLIFPIDRTGQIDLFSSEVRLSCGKRPRGISLCASSWDSSLLSTFYSCGIEYVLLDESLIPPDKNIFIPLFMSDKGRFIDIIPVYRSLKPSLSLEPEQFISDIKKKINSTVNKSQIQYVEQITEKAAVHIEFTPVEFLQFLNEGWFSKFLLQKNEDIEILTSSSLVKNISERVPVYIPAGISSEVSQWAFVPYKPVKNQSSSLKTIHDFLQIYPQSHALYDRMLYLSLLVNQSHGDRLRKKSAREKLWQAQNGAGFVCTSKGAFVNSTYRQNAYKFLSEAEKILRGCSDFSESLVSFDYNVDGIKEYICRMQNYFAVIALKGGSIREFDIMQNSGNYADNLNRIKEFEGSTDDYERGLFIDHLFTDEEFDDYLENKSAANGIFSRAIFSEVKFSASRKEVLLSASKNFKKNQKVLLKKKYIAYSSGMMIQYILKNESTQTLKAKFVVETSLAQTNFSETDFNAFKLEIIANEEKKEIDTKQSSRAISVSGLLHDVEGFQITDTDNSISFVFEPNESCALCFEPIIFRRPDYFSGELVPAGMTFSNAMLWEVNLEPGMEMEKTINFTIINQHKKK